MVNLSAYSNYVWSSYLNGFGYCRARSTMTSAKLIPPTSTPTMRYGDGLCPGESNGSYLLPSPPHHPYAMARSVSFGVVMGQVSPAVAYQSG
jgi:hypothetical protein